MFVDTEFPANNSVIGNIDCPIPADLKWVRPIEIMDKVRLYEDGVEPTDILQGCLGDCYFLSSLAAMAEWEPRVKRIIKVLGNGKYECDYYYMGRKTPVVVDDIIAVSHGKPFFSRNSGNELWVILLEKAYAKVVGSYEKIEGGIPYLALCDITGMPAKRIAVRDYDPDELWRKLTKFDEKDYAMCANVPSVPGIDLEKVYGLIEDHAYTVTGTINADGNKLVKIRNPWGHGEWNGKWCDSDPNWTPALKKKFDIVEADDGIFYMDIHDFVKFYDEVTVLYYKDKWNAFDSFDLQMTHKQHVVQLVADGETIIFLNQTRDGEKIALRFWVVDEKGMPVGGNSEETFVISSNIRGRKVKVSKGTYNLYVETHTSHIAKLPKTITISARSQKKVEFIATRPLEDSEKAVFMTKEMMKKSTAGTCKACGLPLPERGIAKTKIGNFHLKCFKCDLCGGQLQGRFGIRGDKKICPDCMAKK